MNKVEQVFLTILRCAVLGETTESLTFSFSDQEWKDFVALAYRQGTHALVFNEVLRRKDDMPEGLRNEMRSSCAMQMMKMPRLQDLLRTTFSTLQQAHLQPVLLKGFGLAELYPRPELRSWGDLDVYVGPDQYHEAAGVLRDAFPGSLHHDEEWEELKHYCFVLPDGLVEMHRVTVKMDYPKDKKVYYQLENEAMSPDKVEHISLREPDMQIDIPESKFNMLFTFLHAWNHFVEEGLGMKQLCDVFLLARKTYEKESSHSLKEYENYILRHLQDLHLMEAWQLIGYILVEYMNLPDNMWPGYWGTKSTSLKDQYKQAWLNKHGEMFFRRVMEEGVLRDEAAEKMKTRYSDREKSLKMSKYLRKLKTLRIRIRTTRWLRPYSGEYARHLMAISLYRGIKRLFKKDEAVLY
ncbi:MAG: nucleotidyltransferase family protein [Paludibacteraceae bacterium]|nr:nucleotidyltransferase family protein [Paludibacteraceae bacterium]